MLKPCPAEDEPISVIENSQVFVLRKNFDSTSEEEWNSIARQCCASYKSSFRYLRMTHLLKRHRQRMILFEIFLIAKNTKIKIGQSAIAVSNNERIFEDKLLLLPAYAGYWIPAMRALLAELGPGIYRYGWLLNIERSHSDELAKIPSVTIHGVRQISVHYVDFSLWKDWEHYFRCISNNSKRNAMRAEKELPNLRIEIFYGAKIITKLLHLVKARRIMYKSKFISFNEVSALISYLGRTLLNGKNSYAAFACNDSENFASVSGINFGENNYYLDGGRAEASHGAAWYLMIAMLRNTYNISPTGKFVMGYVDYAIHDDAVGGGLLRSRHSCRVAEQATSIVSFSFDPVKN